MQPAAQQQTQYEAILTSFQDRFNQHERAKKLVKDWNRWIVLTATDTGSQFALVVDNQEMTDVRPIREFDEDADNIVHLEAEETVLGDIFSGKYNPATALMDGALAVFSKERDKVKLEALAMVIWRLGS